MFFRGRYPEHALMRAFLYYMAGPLFSFQKPMMAMKYSKPLPYSRGGTPETMAFTSLPRASRIENE